MCSHMADALHRILGTFHPFTASPVGAATRPMWPAEHKLWSFGWGFGIFLLTLLFSFNSLAQDAAGPALLFTTEAGVAAQLPLVEEKISVAIDQGHASSTFRHSFQNESQNNLEGTYRIQLGTIATATGFSYWNGKERIVGEIFEREAAQRVYETVTGTGRDPGLLEQTAEGTFSFRVAPITPGEKKLVEVTTSEWLRQVEDLIEYQAPLGKDGEGSSFLIRDTRKIVRVSSPTHHIRTSESQSAAQEAVLKVAVGKAKGGATKLILRYQVGESPFSLSAALHQSKGHDGYAVVSLAAPKGLKQEKLPRDVTLVVDRSGSMSGEPLEAARRATEGVIRRLGEDDFVNVVTFDDGIDSLFSSPTQVKTARNRALQFTQSMQAGGGTDLALALQEALSRQAQSGRSQVILFLTDGQSDPASALAAAKMAPPSVRLYTVGIGSGVDRPLLSRLARENRGRFTYVADESNLERDVDRLFSSIETPILTDVKLEIAGAEMRRVYPRQSPDLFSKDQLTYVMRLRPHESRKPLSIKVTANQHGQKRVFERKISLPDAAGRNSVGRPWVGRLWAQKRVDDLLEQMSLSGETPELKKETIELALAYGLVTRYTSFLAIPESEISEAVRGTMDEERARRARILEKHKDAAALSRTIMPPGDPVITVRAPRSSQGVTAVFPFGLTLDLSYEPALELWQGRFLVPNHVPDGAYDVEIFVADRDGTVTSTTTSYEIDSQPPAFEVHLTDEAGKLRVSVDGDEALREVRVTLDSTHRGGLFHGGKSCGAGGCKLQKLSDTHFAGVLSLPAGKHQLRFVVADTARNESVRLVEVEISGGGR
jgi:Ca-activated chloride channel homolog